MTKQNLGITTYGYLTSLGSGYGARGPMALLSAFVFAVGLWGCGGGSEAQGATQDQAYTRIINVETVRVAPSSFTQVLRLTGTIRASQDVTISAEESGVVREILVDKGNWVGEGQPIFRLDADLLQAQVDQARALADMARETWERRKRLYEEDQVGSELVYLEAKYGYEQASANLNLLEERLERTVIRAPIAGVLDSRTIEVGTMVAPGTPVARLVALNPVKVTAGVPERYSAQVRPGSEVSVTIGALGESFRGTVSYVGAVIDPGNRTFPIEFAITNPRTLIKPEMVADVSVDLGGSEDRMVVPQEALIRVETGYVVFVVEGEGGAAVAHSRPVVLGPAQNNKVVVSDGLEPGERLVVVGQQRVAEGDRVNVVAERQG